MKKLNYEENNEDKNKLSIEQAREWLHRIQDDPKHPYLNDTAPQRQRDLAVAFVNRLYEIINGTKDTISGYVDAYEAQKEQEMKDAYGEDPTGENRSSKFGERPPEQPPLDYGQDRETKADFSGDGRWTIPSQGNRLVSDKHLEIDI